MGVFSSPHRKYSCKIVSYSIMQTAKKISEQVPDIAAIMAEIRQDVKRSLRQEKTTSQQEEDLIAGDLRNSEELRYLNGNYSFGNKLNPDTITSHRPWPIGPTIVFFKKQFLKVAWHFFQDYFSAEREYNMNLLRFLNQTSKYVDERDAANFWHLISKVENELTTAKDKIDRVSDDTTASLRGLEKGLHGTLAELRTEFQARLDNLEGTVSVQETSIKTLENVASGLEHLVNKFSTTETTSTPITKEIQQDKADVSYLMFENRYRGSQEDISKRLSIYPEIFKESEKPVMEIGGGRGELQQLFSDAAIKSYSLECDPTMVDLANEQKRDVRLGDGIEHLAGLADSSIGGLIAVQVIEHLPHSVLRSLMELAAKKIAPGGKVVFETINPRSLLALSSNYFRDPTHVWPMHPDTVCFMMELAGLKIEEVRELSPIPEKAKLLEVAKDSSMTPRWEGTVDTINHNLRQLNEFLYGAQDYCIIAEVR